ncbi:MAG: hypothetical protein K9M45_08765 [Kiritimatiellales bacterium]|nr:hypothetical protein [Kiritimatiellales bacterium]
MKIQLFVTAAFAVAISSLAVTTVDPANKYAYGANIGWINAYADEGINGAVIGQAFCSGYMYGVNVGWINLGDGSPANGMAYANDSATDYGINHDGLGNLSGYAYGANIGWVNFEQTYGQPKVNLETGTLSGYVWGANVGWINLSGLKTLSLGTGPDSDSDTIPDSWELGHTNTLAVLDKNGKDSDDDGVPDVSEYDADTDPFDDTDFLRITDFQTLETTNLVTWAASKTRRYTLQHALMLTNTIPWSATSAPFIPASSGDVTETVPGVGDANRFYRVQAEPPLSP